MAFNVGAIVAELQLRKDAWDAAIKSVQKDQESMAGFIVRNRKEVEEFGKKLTFVGAAVTGAFGLMVKSSADYADNLGKLSQKVGISVETLSGLKLAADHSDVSIEQLSQGIGLLAKRAVAASEGSAEASGQFAKIGVSATDSAGKVRPMDDVLGDVADRFAAMPDSAEKTALAMDLFGRSGKDLIPLLNGGAEGLRRERAEAERLGLVISTETSKAAETMNDSFTTLKASTLGLANSVAQSLIPSVTAIVQKVTNVIASVTAWAREHPRLTEAISKTAIGLGVLATAVGTATFLAPRLISAWGGIKMALDAVKFSAGGVSTALSFLAKNPIMAALIAVSAATAAVIAWKNSLSGTTAEIVAQAKAVHDYQLIIRAAYRNLTPELLAEMQVYQRELRAQGKTWDEMYPLIIEKLHGILVAHKDAAAQQQVITEAGNRSLINLSQSLVDKIKEATLDEYAFKRYQAKRFYEDSLQQISEAAGLEVNKTAAKSLAMIAYQKELTKVDREEHEKRVKAVEDAAKRRVHAEELAQKAVDKLMDERDRRGKTSTDLIRLNLAKAAQMWAGYTQTTKQLAMDEFGYKKAQLLDWYNAELAALRNLGLAESLLTAMKKTLDKSFTLQAKALAKERALWAIQMGQEFLGAITGLVNQEFSRKKQALDDDYERRKEWIQNNLTDEGEREAALAKLDADYSAKKRKLARDEAIANKNFQLAQAIMGTAAGIAKALPNIFLAAIAAAMGAIQIATIARTPIPALARGGITTGETMALLGDNPSGREAVIPLDDPQARRQLAEVVGGEKSGRRELLVSFNVTAIDAQGVEQFMYQRAAPVLRQMLRDEFLVVPAKAIRGMA